MSCGKRSGKRESIRRQLSEIYARVLAAHGQEKAVAAMLAHRLAQCTHASECGRICTHLAKRPGVAGVFCAARIFPQFAEVPESQRRFLIDRDGPDKGLSLLYDALEDPDFECPVGFF